MVDKVTKEQRRKNMQSVKSKGSKIENVLCAYLWKNNIRYRRNVKKLFGKPDIVIAKYKIVIFVDSCFWHKCPIHYKSPGTNTVFWENKITKNVLRDQQVNQFYKDNDWNILRIWEHDLKNNFETTLKRILRFINEAKEK